MSSPGPSNSPPASKRPAETSDISELVHKAKASRYAAPKPPDDDEDLEDLLEKQLTCSICTDLYLNPVLVLPCLHSFCGPCTARWLRSNTTCPSCRGLVTDTAPNAGAAELVELLLEKFPDKKRPDDELQELNAFYSPGQKITIFNEEEEYGSEEEDDDGEPDRSGGRRPPLGPCECCDPNNPHGYICPTPVPADAAEGGANRPPSTGHTQCTFCGASVPTLWRPYQCDVCSEVCCGNMFRCLGRADHEGYVANVQDQTFALPGSPTPGTRSWISFGSVEQERLLNYVSRNNISWETIGAQLVQVILGPDHALEGVRNLCKGCASTMFEASLMRWWIWYQENEHIADDRVNCWYGYTCRTQTHNRSHAARLNHACNPTPLDQRRNNAPPRDPGPAPPPADSANEDSAQSLEEAAQNPEGSTSTQENPPPAGPAGDGSAPVSEPTADGQDAVGSAGGQTAGSPRDETQHE